MKLLAFIFEQPSYILTDDENYHGTQNIKSVFFVFSCADNSFKNGLQKP